MPPGKKKAKQEKEFQLTLTQKLMLAETARRFIHLLENIKRIWNGQTPLPYKKPEDKKSQRR